MLGTASSRLVSLSFPLSRRTYLLVVRFFLSVGRVSAAARAEVGRRKSIAKEDDSSDFKQIIHLPTAAIPQGVTIKQSTCDGAEELHQKGGGNDEHVSFHCIKLHRRQRCKRNLAFKAIELRDVHMPIMMGCIPILT